MLGPVLHLIRIPTISLTDFSNHVSKSGLLTPEECVRMFQYFTADDKPGNMDFICEPRRKIGTERRCRRFPYFLHVSSTFYGKDSKNGVTWVLIPFLIMIGLRVRKSNLI